MRWWRRLSLRARLLLLGVGALAGGLAVGGAVMVAALDATLRRSADTEALRTGRDVAALVEAGALPQPLPVPGGQVVQVIDARHRVRAASVNADRLVPMLRTAEVATVRAGTPLSVPGHRIGEIGPVRVVAVPAGVAGEPLLVLVAKPVGDFEQSVRVVGRTMLVAFPVLVLVLTVVAWRVVGATLRPVEALRAGAEEITGSARSGTLPVPGSRDEIHRLAVTLNGMLDRLDAARASQRAFVADAAHELRSPLANMRTELEVARRLGPATDWPQVADGLLADTERLARLVDDLLLLARADDAQPRRRMGPVELGGLLRAVAQRNPESPVRVTDAPPLWVEGDPDELHRLVANLVDNAVRHARTGVVLAAAHDGPYQLVTVTDDGPGVPVADRDRVFDRFTRLDDARARDAGGAGLGLAIVRELVRRHGGRIRLADAEPGRAGCPGLRVEVRLPAAPVIH